jgi:hypothetical protein
LAAFPSESIPNEQTLQKIKIKKISKITNKKSIPIWAIDGSHVRFYNLRSTPFFQTWSAIPRNQMKITRKQDKKIICGL